MNFQYQEQKALIENNLKMPKIIIDTAWQSPFLILLLLL